MCRAEQVENVQQVWNGLCRTGVEYTGVGTCHSHRTEPRDGIYSENRKDMYTGRNMVVGGVA